MSRSSHPRPKAPGHRLTWVAVVLGAVIAIPLLGRAAQDASDPRPVGLATTVVAPSQGTTSIAATSAVSPSSGESGASGTTATPPPTTPVAPSPAASSSGPGPGTPRASTPAARPGRALAVAATLTVKGRAPRTGYSRDAFGQAWLDVDRNGCDTRNDVLRRDLTNVVLKAGTRGCLVLRGTLRDPYTARTISFVRGVGTSNAVQIDHVVALSDAWQKGAQGWSATTRAAFANDSLNLLAVDGPSNLRKGVGDTATWLPPNKVYRCAYVARQVGVKAKYGVWVTAAERDAMTRVLSTCPDEPVPTAQGFTLGGGREEVVAPSAPEPVAPKPAASKPAATAPAPFVGAPRTDPRYPTCTAAKKAGFGPYRSGVDPEYDWYRDADHDGIVCE